MRRQEFDDELVLDFKCVQDKFQLPALNDLFTRVSQFLTTYEDGEISFTLNPMALTHGYLIRSGRKILTDYFIDLPDWTAPTTPEDVVDVLYNVLHAMYFHKWEQLRDAFYTEYMPLEGVDYTETRNGSHVGTENFSGVATTEGEKTDTTTHGEQVTSQSSLEHGESISDNNTITHGKTVSEDGTVARSSGQTDTTVESPGQVTSTSATSTGAEDVYGFNSSEAVPKAADSASNTETTTTSGSNTTEVNRLSQGNDITESTVTEGGTTADARSILHGGTDTTNGSVVHSGVDTVGSESAQTETVTRENATTDADNMQIVRKGRIAQTPQELLEEEIRVRKNNFVEIIYQDIDSVLTISVY